MKVLIFITAAVMLSAADVYGQAGRRGACELQELAIDPALGDAAAQYNLGVEFHRGDKIPRDLARAALMWRLALAGGVPAAANNLGHLTYYGRGVKQDYAEGVRLWRLAAEKGFAESQIHLGHAYTDGRHLTPDYVEAYAWAKAGRENSRRAGDAEGEAVTKMADELLAALRPKLTAAQLADAERRAAGYLARYAARPE